MKGNLKNLIYFAIIGVCVVLIYFIYFKQSPDEESGLVTVPGTAMPAMPDGTVESNAKLGQDFLVLLLNVKNIKLDDSIFLDPAFMSLRDSSIVLVQDTPEGRPNPFAPIGSENPGSQASTNPGTQ